MNSVELQSDEDYQSLQYDALFERIATSLVEQGYFILPGALPQPILNALELCYDTTMQSSFSAAGIGRKSQFVQNQTVRRDEICWIDGTTPEGQTWLNWLEMLKAYLNRSLFMGLFSVESHLARYRSGAFYKRHYDAFAGQRSRMVSMVTYLNENWSVQDGGELVLYKHEHDAEGIKVLPLKGTLVVFLSEQFPHEVLISQRERVSVASWFRVNGTTDLIIDPPK